MRLTLNIAAEVPIEHDLLTLEIPPDSTVDLLKESVQGESQIAKTSQHIYHNGILLADDTKTMEQLQIVDGDMLALHVRATARNPAQAQHSARQQQAGVPPSGNAIEQDVELIRLQLLGDARMRQEAERVQPNLIAALENPPLFAQLFRQMQEAERNERVARQQRIAELNADPFDVEAQMKIAETIREERVQENLQSAIEHNPEVFGRVHMLYIDVEVNGRQVKAFVDSGAQATIMSPGCAEACGIMRLVDTRFAGIARGVGTAKILGRVHSAPIKIGSLFLTCSFTVMEGKDVDLLLGLDMLKRHQACLDLRKDSLIIQGEEIPFLGEADIPKRPEEIEENEPSVSGPGGRSIGGRSGAVSGPPEGHIPIAPVPGPSTNAPPGPQAQPSQQTPAPFAAEAIAQLENIGCSRAEAVNALQACNGDVELAAALLFQG